MACLAVLAAAFALDAKVERSVTLAVVRDAIVLVDGGTRDDIARVADVRDAVVGRDPRGVFSVYLSFDQGGLRRIVEGTSEARAKAVVDFVRRELEVPVPPRLAVALRDCAACHRSTLALGPEVDEPMRCDHCRTWISPRA